MHSISIRFRRAVHIAAALFPLTTFVAASRADIFQWEYINSADPSQGKQQSTTLAPGGAGVDAVPGVNLNNRNLTMAYLIAADLTNANGYQTNLTDADLSQANLTNVNLSFATLTGAIFTDAQVQGASFFGITPEQLYSTVSYRAHDLTGIALTGDLSGWNFAGQNLSDASFSGTFAGTDFTGAEVRGANFYDYSATGFTPSQLYSTASYQAHDLTGISLHNDLTGWNFAGQNLTSASFRAATLTGANFSEANLANSNFSGAILTDADFTGADVRGANFDKGYGPYGYSLYGTGITLAQLYSTASYQTHDLTGISLGVNDLSDGNFAGQNLTNASFGGTNLMDANLRGANLTNAHFGGAFVQGYANLTNADFTDAEVRGADVGGTGITPSQLYSTASYQAHDLRGIKFGSDDLSGWNFAGQNLTNSSFGIRPLGPNSYQVYATLTGADFTSADARGAYLNPADAITKNLILPDGHIDGLELDGGRPLVVRDYDAYPYYGIAPLPITVDQQLAMGPGGTLRMIFEADAWYSTISFAPGIPVTLGGTLELTFANDTNLASQIGHTLHLFDWTGVNPTDAFAISSPYAWDLSNLYITGEVTLTAVPEPANHALAAAIGVVLLRRRRRRKSTVVYAQPQELISGDNA